MCHTRWPHKVGYVDRLSSLRVVAVDGLARSQLEKEVIEHFTIYNTFLEKMGVKPE